MVWKSYHDTQKLLSQSSVNIKNWEESNKHLPKIKSTTCIIEITSQENEKYLRGEIHLLACLLTLWHLRNFPCEFTEKCFAVFDQSSHAIYLTWYRLLLFFREFSSVIPFMVWLQDSSQIKGRGYIFMFNIVC